jgi:hypothetical protein
MADVDQQITLRGFQRVRQHLPFTTVLFRAPPEVAPAGAGMRNPARGAGWPLTVAGHSGTIALNAGAHVANDQHKKRGNPARVGRLVRGESAGSHALPV